MDSEERKQLNNILEECRNTVRESGNGHLPLPKRVKLMKSIGDKNLTNKIFYECAKKIAFLWRNEGDRELFDIMNAVEGFLYHSKGKELEIENLADRGKIIVEKYEGIETLAGYTNVALAYSTAYEAEQILKIEGYDGESDDNSFQWKQWNPDFFASMAYSGGNPFINEGNPNLRKEFWFWYLDTVKAICENPQHQVINEKKIEWKKVLKSSVKEKKIPERTQTYRTKELIEKIEKVLFNTLVDLQKHEGNKAFKYVIVEGDCLDEGIDQNAYFVMPDDTEKDILLDNYLFGDERSSAVIMDQVKTKMYEQAKGEGAWISYKIILDRLAGKYYLDFNYDDFNKVAEIRKDSETFINEFGVFPRDRKYTPQWWLEILK